MLERFFIVHRVQEENTLRASIVSCADRFETFLARRIPYLQLKSLPLAFDCFDFEVDPDRRDEVGRERVVAVAGGF